MNTWDGGGKKEMLLDVTSVEMVEYGDRGLYFIRQTNQERSCPIALDFRLWANLLLLLSLLSLLRRLFFLSDCCFFINNHQREMK